MLHVDTSALLSCKLNYDRMHGRLLVSHYLVTTYSPCIPAVRLDARILLTVLLSLRIIPVM
jgi:hypothetical protein